VEGEMNRWLGESKERKKERKKERREEREEKKRV
jgi:hypothetical protein